MIAGNTISEALFVGFYSLIIFIILKPFAPKQILWFCVGFFKHFMGYFIGLHTYYCKYGHACNKRKVSGTDIRADITYLLPRSILEGLLFILIGYFTRGYNPYVAVAVAGVAIHLLAELSGLHKYFCSHVCKINVFI
jgi:hypothetical protein